MAVTKTVRRTVPTRVRIRASIWWNSISAGANEHGQGCIKEVAEAVILAVAEGDEPTQAV
ncbi:hypothetical protein WOLCODRAFT_167220 [Wolfiporia cocos MD-104 SS10]|uniref:Uncharacterized protein n=1 Tax=Wolfiporia cocos (strain MD-104) TaxID=742152 RepID=A0A2H3JGU9_WOLCO|nr:hypothetical protein WOLCODRAFT_167220 [Wolfiporia cocos MD-104 SS10]